MRLLLTGATGFVGRNLLLDAVRSGRYEAIFVPVRSTEKLKAQWKAEGRELPSEVHPIQADATQWNIEGLRPDHVIHAASILFGSSWEEYFKTNVLGTLSLLEALPATSRVLILSSQTASGPCAPGKEIRTEDDPAITLTLYSKSKQLMEEEVQKRFADRDLLFLRPPMVLGPRDQATLPLFRMARGRVRFRPGFQLKHYSFIGVEGLVSAIWCAFQKPDWRKATRRAYFVAAEKPVTDLDILSAATHSCQRRGLTLPVPQPLLRVVSLIVEAVPAFRRAVPALTRDRAKDIWPNRWVVSSAAFREEFGWDYRGNLEQAIRETHDWYVHSGLLQPASP